jgi:hypothetical protein
VQDYDQSRLRFNHRLAHKDELGLCSENLGLDAYNDRIRIFNRLVRLEPAPRRHRQLDRNFETVLRWSLTAVSQFTETGDRAWLTRNSEQIAYQMAGIRRELGISPTTSAAAIPRQKPAGEAPRTTRAASQSRPMRRASETSVIESQIDGDFEGWDGETIFKLTNGQIWQQTGYDYTYSYAYMPEVTIYKTSGGWKMKVEDVEETIYVRRLK